MRRYLLVSFSLLISSVVALRPAAAQQPQDCLPALKPDIVDLSKNVETNLVLLDRMLKNSSESEAKSVGAKYDDSTFDYGQSKTASNSIEKMLNVNYSNKERDTVYLSTLSDNAVKAYVACVGATDEITVTFAGNVLDTNPFFLRIDWQPKERPADGKAKLFVKVSQGTIEESAANQVTGEIRDRKSALVTINRDPTAKLQIAVRVSTDQGDNIKLVSVPERSKFKLIKGTISSTESPGSSLTANTRETSGNVGGPVCVKLANNVQDRIIVPQSFQLINIRDQRQRVTRTDHAAVANEREVCAQVDLVFDTVFQSYVNADIRATAQILIAVPSS